MAAGYTTTTEVSDFAPKFIAAARVTLARSNVTGALLWNMTLPLHEGKTVNQPKLSKPSAPIAMTEGVPLAQAQQLSTSNVAITPSRIGLQIVLTDDAIETSGERLIALAGRAAGLVFAEKVDDDLTANWDNFSTSLGTAGTVITKGHVHAGYTRVVGNSTEPPPPDGQIYCMLHANQIKALGADLAPSGEGTTTVRAVPSNEIATEILRRFSPMNLFNMPIIENSNMAIDGADDCKGAVFHRDAVIYVKHLDLDTRIREVEDLPGQKINQFMKYGSGEYQDVWGVEMYFDATAPTS